MKKVSKKILALVLSLIIAISIVPLSGLNIAADAATGDDVVAYARLYLGYPYVSGARGPSAFDCSGFVYYIFSHFGIYIPNSTSEIWNNMSKYGTVIGNGTTANAQAGDLIVWYNHVSIYTSNGGCIEALNPRTGVTEYLPVNSHTNGMNYYVLRVSGLENAKVEPQAPVISVNKTKASTGELITVTWDDVFGAESYRVNVKSGILTFVNSETEDCFKTFALPASGDYTVTVYAKNSFGEAESNQVALTITSSIFTHTHKYSSKVTTAATCESAGVKTFTCSCGDSYTEPIPATGHSYGEWINTKLPTANAEGTKQRTCKNCQKTETQSVPKLAADAVVLDKLSISLKAGETAQLTANKSVSWYSSDTKVATVDSNGKVTAVGAGKATITAVSGNSTATCSVTVTASFSFSLDWVKDVFDVIMQGLSFILGLFGI